MGWPNGWSGLGYEPAPRALSRVNAAIRARVSVAVDEDAAGVSGTIWLAAVHGVRAQEKHRARIHQQWHRASVEHRIQRRMVFLQKLMALATAARNHQ